MQLIRPVQTCPWHRRRWECTTVASVTGVMLTLFHLLRLTAGAEPSSSSSFFSPPRDDGVRHLSWCNNRKSATLLFLLISCHMTPDELLQAWTRLSQFFLLLHLCDVIQRGRLHPSEIQTCCLHGPKVVFEGGAVWDKEGLFWSVTHAKLLQQSVRIMIMIIIIITCVSSSEHEELDQRKLSECRPLMPKPSNFHPAHRAVLCLCFPHRGSRWIASMQTIRK